MNQLKKAYVAIFGSVFIWGTAIVVSKYVLNAARPLTITALRFMIAYLFLLPFAIKRGFKPGISFERKYLWLGLIGYALSSSLQNIGLQFTSSTMTVLIQSMLPVCTLIFAGVLLKEKATHKKVLGIVVSISGISIAVFSGINGNSANTWYGMLLILISIAFWGAYSVLSKMYLHHEDSVITTIGVFGGGLLFLIPASIIEILMGNVPVFSFNSILGLLYLGVFCSALGFLFWNYAIKKIDTTKASLIYNLVPVVGILAATVTGEEIFFMQIVGGVITVFGIMMCDS
ncbi:MAG: EamA family transporter [Eubacteriales bacterium]|nr:EamA family transporter [Eubacteriales bacterium]